MRTQPKSSRTSTTASAGAIPEQRSGDENPWSQPAPERRPIWNYVLAVVAVVLVLLAILTMFSIARADVRVVDPTPPSTADHSAPLSLG